MVSFADGLAARGLDVITFNFLYTEQGRRASGSGYASFFNVTASRNGIMPRSSAPTFSIWWFCSARRWPMNHSRPALVLGDPVFGVGTILNVLQDASHRLSRRIGDDTRSAGVVSMLGRVTD